MSAVDVHTADVERAVDDDDDLAHIYCCINDTVGLCGTRLTGPADETTPLCIVCADLEVNDYEHCPVLGMCIE